MSGPWAAILSIGGSALGGMFGNISKRKAVDAENELRAAEQGLEDEVKEAEGLRFDQQLNRQKKMRMFSEAQTEDQLAQRDQNYKEQVNQDFLTSQSNKAKSRFDRPQRSLARNIGGL